LRQRQRMQAITPPPEDGFTPPTQPPLLPKLGQPAVGIWGTRINS